MAIKIGFGGLVLALILVGILWYVDRKKKKVAEAKLAELQGEVE